MKITEKIISVTLAVIMVITLIPAAVITTAAQDITPVVRIEDPSVLIESEVTDDPEVVIHTTITDKDPLVVIYSKVNDEDWMYPKDAIHCAYCGKELPAENVEILGDVDGDREATISDVTFIRRYCAYMDIPVSEDVMLRRGDVDGDGEVAIIDATFIQRFDVYIDTPYLIGEPIS